VALDLARDVRGGEGGELDAALDVEAVDGLDEADGADLHEIVEGLAAVRVAAGDVPHERHHALDEHAAGFKVAVSVIQLEEADLVDHSGSGSGFRGAHGGHPAEDEAPDKPVRGGQATRSRQPTFR
jgi:hypothetical protein